MKNRLKIILLCSSVMLTLSCSNHQKTLDELYLAAVNDAAVAETSEIESLVNLQSSDNRVTIKDNKVLLTTFHHYPSSYVPGTKNENIAYYMWTFSDQEAKQWYLKNADGVTDWHLRFCQLLGMYHQSTNGYFSAVWADLNDVVRPAYVTDTTQEMKNSLEGGLSQDYIEWFNSQYINSFSSETLAWRSPWTRLGYTYDWADNQKEYGLSEFLILKGSTVEVEYTKTVDEFVTYLAE